MRMKQRAQVSEAHGYTNNSHMEDSQIPTTLQAYNYMPDTDILLTNIFQTHGTVSNAKTKFALSLQLPFGCIMLL